MTGIAKLFTQKLHMPGYELIEPVSQETQAVVYRAIQTETQHPVLIKFLSPEHLDIKLLTQICNQYTVAQKLSIEGFARPIGLEVWDKSYALIMEDFKGILLSEYVRNESLDLAEKLILFIDLIAIIDGFHRHNFVLQNIHPSKILIDPKSKQLKLFDLGATSWLSKENPYSLTSCLSAYSNVYNAPEQTGCMNRTVDYRADFYALGVVLYELLAGEILFVSHEPLELSHFLMTQVPPAADIVNPEVPSMVAAIAAKLMAKNVEDRYQTPLGLKHDLQQCLNQWTESKTVGAFELGLADRRDRFLIPDKLYGREKEVRLLMDAFDRVSNGSSELMLVVGSSGVGKTAVVNEVHKPITQKAGYFIKGKFEQVHQNVPFFGFVRALRDLIGQLLGEGNNARKVWKTQLLDALGNNAQIVLDLIPELEEITGVQPLVSVLTGTAAQNRFTFLLDRFIRVIATATHPLVIFFDDLQWADSASLNLMQVLVAESRIPYLLLIGAYREGGVSPSHPMQIALTNMTRAGALTQAIALQPLQLNTLNHLIADILQAPASIVQPLTKLVFQKTQGNPFFTNQFLLALHQDELVTFDRQAGYWQCDLAKIKQAALTDEVAEFMAVQLRKLPTASQDILKLASCIGNQFDLQTLAIVAEHSEMEAARLLWPALEIGLVLPQSEIYKFYLVETPLSLTSVDVSKELVGFRFLHDRVQQAAYSSISKDLCQQTHLKIGRLLQDNLPEEGWQGRLFEIVNHLNFGIAFLTHPEEREGLARLNLAAGQKSKSKTAYGEAITYCSFGISLLPMNLWDSYYDLTLAFYNVISEASYLNTDFGHAEQCASIVLQNSRTLLDTINVQKIRIRGAIAQGHYFESIAIGLEVLQTFGIAFPEHPTQKDIEQALDSTRGLWIEVKPTHFLDLPKMDDSRSLAAMEILSALTSAAYVAAPSLMPLLICKQIELSITNGNSPISITAYAEYGVIVMSMMNNPMDGFAFAKLSLDLLEEFDANSLRCRVFYVVYAYIIHWRESLAEILPCLQKGYLTGLETGDIEYLSLNATTYCGYAFYCSDNTLEDLLRMMEDIRQLISQKKQSALLILQQIELQTVSNLQGCEEVPSRLSGKFFDRLTLLPELMRNNQRSALFTWYFKQTYLSYLFEQKDDAALFLAETAQYLESGIGLFDITRYALYAALIHLDRYSEASQSEKCAILNQVSLHQAQLQDWAKLAPMNHQHCWELIEAVRCGAIGQHYISGDFYDRAIASARNNGFIQEEALANELAAKFYMDWGKERVARGYMEEAHCCYTRWGAKAKIADLEKRYPNLLKAIVQKPQSFDPQALSPDVVEAPTSRDSLSELTLTQNLGSSNPNIPLAVSGLHEKLLGTDRNNSNISESKKVNLSLPESERSFENFAAAVPVVIYRLDKPLHVSYVSELWSEMTGRPADEALGYGWMNALHPDDREAFIAEWSEIYSLEDIPEEFFMYGSEGRHLRPDGSVNWFYSRLARELDDHGNVVGYIGSLSDITKQKEVEIALQKAQNQLFRITENVPGMIYRCIHHPDGSDELIYVNSQVREIFELEPDIVLHNAERMWERVHPDDIHILRDRTQRHSESTPQSCSEFRLNLPQKGLRWMQDISYLERQDNGDLVWDGVIVDISDRKFAEEKLKEAETKHHSIISNLGGVVYRFLNDDEWITDYCSPASLEISGCPPEHFIGQSIEAFKEFIHPEDIDKVMRDTDIALDTKKAFQLEYRINHQDGSIRYVEEYGKGIFDDRGELKFIEGVILDVSDRKRAERAQAQLTAVLEATPDYIGISDAEGRGIWRNHQLLALRPDLSEESYQLNIFDFHPAWVNSLFVNEAFPIAIENGSWSGEAAILDAEGNEIPISMVLISHSENGTVERFSAIMRNISTTKSIEKKLKLTQFAYSKSALAVFWIQKDGLILDVNESTCSVLGYSQEVLKGYHIWDVNPDLTPEEWPGYWENIKQNTSGRFEVRHQRKDGDIFPVEVLCNFLNYEGEEFIFAQVQDISERKQAEYELKSAQERLSLALKSGDLGYWQWMIATNELYWDDRLYELHGISHGALNFDALLSSLHPEDVLPFEELIECAIAQESFSNELGCSNPYEVIYRVICPDGLTNYLKTYGTVLLNDEGDATGMLGITFNITPFKLAEAQLELSNRELQQASRLKDEFLATISHELRTPLNTVLGMTENLQGQIFGEINSAQMDSLSTIEKSSMHLLQLINDILDLSKINAGKTELSLDFADVAQLCRVSLELVQPLAKAKNIYVRADIPDNLPHVELDEQRIRQALVNLLSNAVKFTPDRGQITLKVHPFPVPDPRGVCSGGFLQIVVSDTGIGISPKHLTTLFQPFTQIDNALNRQYAGTGLGLALVKQIIELHGGKVSVSSEVAKGSSFTLELPWLTFTPPGSQNSFTNESSDTLQCRPMRTFTVLLVEDDPASILTISSYLDAKGFRLVLAQNGEDAIELCQTLNPDIVLMDIQLPGMDGLETTTYIRQTLGLVHLPIVALTALAMTSDRDRCLQAGATDYLSKPVKLKQLVALLQTHLSQ